MNASTFSLRIQGRRPGDLHSPGQRPGTPSHASIARANGPAICRRINPNLANRRAVGPTDLTRQSPNPGRWPGLGKLLELRPVKTNRLPKRSPWTAKRPQKVAGGLSVANTTGTNREFKRRPRRGRTSICDPSGSATRAGLVFRRCAAAQRPLASTCDPFGNAALGALYSIALIRRPRQLGVTEASASVPELPLCLHVANRPRRSLHLSRGRP